MKSYRDLEIYQESKRLAIEGHALSLALPKFEMYEEGSQVRRSSKSVTAMIVEGYGRNRYKKDYIKYLVYAQSECDETILHLEFLHETGSFTDVEQFQRLCTEYMMLSRKINKFTQWVEESFAIKQRKNVNKNITPTPATSNLQPATNTVDINDYKL
jgi:four helix bundle protein